LTIGKILGISAESYTIYILECVYTSNPITLSAGSVVSITATVSSNSIATLCWNSSYSGSAGTPLLSMTTGSLVISYITIWHNSSSKGPILSRSVGGSGYLRLLV
jgi:hypothetical protein